MLVELPADALFFNPALFVFFSLSFPSSSSDFSASRAAFSAFNSAFFASLSAFFSCRRAFSAARLLSLSANSASRSAFFCALYVALSICPSFLPGLGLSLLPFSSIVAPVSSAVFSFDTVTSSSSSIASASFFLGFLLRVPSSLIALLVLTGRFRTPLFAVGSTSAGSSFSVLAPRRVICACSAKLAPAGAAAARRITNPNLIVKIICYLCCSTC
mmetsp:Transcript_2441/g.3456  ORF Transcript_2441/g.3456 Transcript_2441/m.3456 type:complete len:215 (-) Transcript_2441:94-738(-)